MFQELEETRPFELLKGQVWMLDTNRYEMAYPP
jgi:hypothetical protein